MNDRTKNILIVVLVCVIVLLVSVLAFSLGVKYSTKDLENSNESINHETENKEQTKENIKIVDYINKSLDKNTIDKSILEKYIVCGFPATETGLGKVEVVLPMIESEKEGAKGFNKMLQEKYAEDIESINPNSKIYTELSTIDFGKIASVFGHRSVKYKYYNSNNYISILVESSDGMLCGSGFAGENSYIYDVDDDKYLTNKAVLEKFKITKELIKTKFIETDPSLESDTGFESSLKDSFEDLYYLYIEDGILNISTNRGMEPLARPTIQIPIN